LPSEVVDRWTDSLAQLARDRDWLDGNARIGGIPAMRSPVETRKFVQEQYELYERLALSLGIRN
jgi:tripartite-type tricarboxylate transporter receptor subunit TctC